MTYVVTIIIIAQQIDAKALWEEHAQHTGETPGGPMAGADRL